MVTPIKPISAVSAGLRVLLVEDHPDSRYALAALLRHRGHWVVEAATPTQALAVPRQDYDVAIIDILMPEGMDGCELMHELVERHGPLRALAFSVAGMERDLARCHQAGFYAHVLKPDLDRLGAMLDAMVAVFRAN